MSILLWTKQSSSLTTASGRGAAIVAVKVTVVDSPVSTAGTDFVVELVREPVELVEPERDGIGLPGFDFAASSKSRRLSVSHD